MSRLSEVLDQMTAVLGSLKEVMDAEQLQLSAGHVNGSALQRITEQKSSLLATLDYQEPSLYGADGQTSSTLRGSKKISI